MSDRLRDFVHDTKFMPPAEAELVCRHLANVGVEIRLSTRTPQSDGEATMPCGSKKGGKGGRKGGKGK